MRVALASFDGMVAQFADEDERLLAALSDAGVTAAIVAWDEPDADWEAYDGVIVRSTWDYSWRRDEFVAWAESVGDRLHNSPAVIRWNSDKRYVGDIADAGLPAVETTYLDPGDEVPELPGELVVKPTLSAGGRDTGRFSRETHADARALIETIHRSGRTAMIQPYLGSVDERGETAVILLDGEPSHVLLKHAVLRPDEVAPVRDDAIGAAEVMYDPGLVVAGSADDDELELAREIVRQVHERTGYLPLYARVDMVAGEDGRPVLMELEAVEPNFYFNMSPGAAERVATAIAERVGAA